jgi:fucose permease
VPNIFGDAVAVAILGLFLGPVYPCATTMFSRLLPRSIQTPAMSFIASAGCSGGAAAPFTTGLLAQAVGTWVLHPVCVVLFVAMLGGWYALPEDGKRED